MISLDFVSFRFRYLASFRHLSPWFFFTLLSPNFVDLFFGLLHLHFLLCDFNIPNFFFCSLTPCLHSFYFSPIFFFSLWWSFILFMIFFGFRIINTHHWRTYRFEYLKKSKILIVILWKRILHIISLSASGKYSVGLLFFCTPPIATIKRNIVWLQSSILSHFVPESGLSFFFRFCKMWHFVRRLSLEHAPMFQIESHRCCYCFVGPVCVPLTCLSPKKPPFSLFPLPNSACSLTRFQHGCWCGAD